MGWTAPKTWVASEVPTASLFNTHLRDNLNALVPAAASVDTSETTASTSYTDLATSGPAVTLTTGTSAIVIMTAEHNNGSIATNAVSFAVSGATTVAASDTYKLSRGIAANEALAASAYFVISGLTAGSNTFTLKYKVSAGTGSFAHRHIFVWSPFT